MKIQRSQRMGTSRRRFVALTASFHAVWVALLSLSLVACVLFIGYTASHAAGLRPSAEPIESAIDVRFASSGLEVLPGINPQAGDSIRIVARLTVDASQAWIRSGVVLDIGSPGDPDSTQVHSPTVLFESGTYKMWYAGEAGSTVSIMYATSPDGVSWTKQGLALSPGGPGESVQVNMPMVLREASSYRMWYAGYDGSSFRIFAARSSDGLSWSRDGLVLDLGPPGSPDSLYVYDPFVLWDGSYKMWYTGTSGGSHLLMYATSPNGLNWTRQGLAVDVGPPGSLEEVHTGWASLLREAGGYHMWYRGSDGAYDRVFYATSDDAVSWTRRGLVLDVGGSTEGTHVVGAFVLHRSPEVPFEMWYAGRSGSVFRIHHATMDPLNFPIAVPVALYLDNLNNGIDSRVVDVTPATVATTEFMWTAWPPGNHTLFAVIDPANALSEVSETNNIESQFVTVRRPPPGLTIFGVTIPIVYTIAAALVTTGVAVVVMLLRDRRKALRGS